MGPIQQFSKRDQVPQIFQKEEAHDLVPLDTGSIKRYIRCFFKKARIIYLSNGSV